MTLSVTAVGALVASAPDASAHGAGADDAPATNFQSVVTESPDIDGLTVRTIDAGSRMEVINTTNTILVVDDYDGRPYLRIGPDGVEENQNSPAVYLNRAADGSTPPPDGIGDGPPKWIRVSTEPSARWHDHRAHWMGGDPPIVAAQPDQRHALAEWTIPMRLGDRDLSVSGTTEWVPGPSPWPWVLLLVATSATVVTLIVARRTATALIVSLAALIPAFAATTVGAWQSNAEEALAKLPAATVPILVLGILIAALVLQRSKPTEALTLAGGGGATAAALTALTSWDWLTRSQLPTALDPPVARAATAVIIGCGLGLVAGAFWVNVPAALARRRAGTAVPPASQRTDRPESAVPARETRAPSERAPMRTRIIIGTVLVALAAATTAGLALERRSTTGAIGDPLDDLCAAIERARTDDAAALRAAFQGPSHDALHQLASRAQARDRSAAADLLRAKQKVEANLGQSGPTLVALARPLPRAIAAAAAAAGEEPPPTCTTEGN